MFRDADEFFNLKLDIFLEDYLYDCMMGADALNHTPLSESSFIHHQNVDGVFASRILNGINNSSPLIKISNDSLNESSQLLDVYYLNNYQDIEDFYCLRSIFDFMVEGVMLYQIFELKIKSLDMINDFWLTSNTDILFW